MAESATNSMVMVGRRSSMPVVQRMSSVSAAVHEYGKHMNTMSMALEDYAQHKNLENLPPDSMMSFSEGSFEDKLKVLRPEIIGRDQILEGPFGPRLKVYVDYTASGQGVLFINKYMTWIRENFANTHTEDSATGRFMTEALHSALHSIEGCVNAGDEFVAIATGTGCTGALLRLQQILGIYVSPASWATLASLAGGPAPVSKVGAPSEPVTMKILPQEGVGPSSQQAPEWLRSREAVKSLLRERGMLPLVLVGGYEHHSNELSWRAGLCDVYRVPLTKDFQLDMVAMESVLQRTRKEQPNRVIMGSISACSNVTGMNTDLRRLSKLLRKYGGRFFVDFAASGPYVHIDCRPDDCPDLFDGFVMSPHKMLGGDGSCGLLMLRRSIYDLRLPPTFAGGGTVRFVGQDSVSFTDDIVERENAGTPGALQIFQCALAFELKHSLDAHKIEEKEQVLLADFFGWAQKEHSGKLFIVGNKDPKLRHAIVSFNIIGPQPLHPRFVTVLLSDLFGVQTRAGCSCAGPHGINLLGIDAEEERTKTTYVVGNAYEMEPLDAGLSSVKPGWCRLNLHYTLDEDEIWFIKEVLTFVIQHGAKFLCCYSFCAVTGGWEFRPPSDLLQKMEVVLTTEGSARNGTKKADFSVNAALGGGLAKTLHDSQTRKSVFEASLKTAKILADSLPKDVKLAPPAAPFPPMVFPSHGPQPHFVVAEGQIHNLDEMAKRVGIANNQTPPKAARGPTLINGSKAAPKKKGWFCSGEIDGTASAECVN